MTDARLSGLTGQVPVTVDPTGVAGRFSGLAGQVVVRVDLAPSDARLSALVGQVVMQRSGTMVVDFADQPLMAWHEGVRYPVRTF
jgi:hypothetical protein